MRCRRLSEKIQNYYSYIVEREVHADEADIIAGLSTNLRMQVRSKLYCLTTACDCNIADHSIQHHTAFLCCQHCCAWFVTEPSAGTYTSSTTHAHTCAHACFHALPACLACQVVLHLYKEALEKVPFFRGKHPQFITTLITYLKLEYYSPGDVIVRQGDMGNEVGDTRLPNLQAVSWCSRGCCFCLLPASWLQAMPPRGC
jgi:hypothetical protein